MPNDVTPVAESLEVTQPLMHVKAPFNQPRKVSAGRGWHWVMAGFGYFKRDPWVWVLICVVGFVLMMALNLIPVVNLVAPALMYVWTGGLVLGCRAQDEGQPLKVGHLFAGFRKNTGSLIGLSVIITLLTLVAVAVAAVIVFLPGGQFFNGSITGASMQAFSVQTLLAVAIAMLLIVPLAMLAWFAVALIVLHDVPVFKAMQLSFKGCLKNVLPLTVYSLVLIALFILAAVPLLLGMLIAVPVFYSSFYESYKDIYSAENISS